MGQGLCADDGRHGKICVDRAMDNANLWHARGRRSILISDGLRLATGDIFPGALTILRELSLGRPVGFLKRRPPTYVGSRDRFSIGCVDRHMLPFSIPFWPAL